MPGRDNEYYAYQYFVATRYKFGGFNNGDMLAGPFLTEDEAQDKANEIAKTTSFSTVVVRSKLAVEQHF